MPPSNALGKTHLLVLNQVVSRLFTFGLNIVVLRYTGADVFGIFAVNLYLIYTVILFLCREPLRRATLQVGYVELKSSSKVARSSRLASTITTTWLVIPLAIIIAISAIVMSPPSLDTLSLSAQLAPFLYTEVPKVLPTPQVTSIASWCTHILSATLSPSSLLEASPTHTYLLCCIITAAAAITELTAEPAHLYAARAGRIGLRVTVEAAANLVRCVATYVLCVWLRGGLLGFALGQLMGSAAWPLVYYTGLHHFVLHSRSPSAGAPSSSDCPEINSVAELLPSRAPLDRPLLALAAPFFVQSLEKLLLTEGEKVVLVAAAPLSARAQGAYAVVQNLASLVLRVLFQPLEEAAALACGELARSVANAEANAEASARASAAVSVQREAAPGKDITTIPPVPAAMAAAGRLRLTLVALLRVVVSLALLLAAMGPHYALSLFALLYGNAWTSTEAPAALAAYCACIVFLAANGIGEAGMYSCVSASDLSRAGRALLAFSGAYVVCCWAATATGLGMIGLLAANAASMALRAWYAVGFLGDYLAQRSVARITWGDALPSPATLMALIFASVGAGVSQLLVLLPVCSDGGDAGCMFTNSMATWLRHGVHIGVGALLFGVVLFVFRLTSWYVVTEFSNLVRSRKAPEKAD